MIIVTATIIANPGERDEIVSKSRDLIKSTRLEPGCISYDLYMNAEDDDILLMLERWETLEALQSHSQTEHFKAFGADIGILVKKVDTTAYSADKI